MPRAPRTVIAGIPHHITQRGNRKEDVFFTEDDRRCYLKWLQEYSEKFGLQHLSYCLMTNHVHLVAVPKNPDSLERVLRPLHMRYAQRMNRLHEWSGHLWQGRYFCSALDEQYMWSAIRYTELNPVRSSMATRAEEYPWSSAAAHCGLRHDPLLSTDPQWLVTLSEVQGWSKWLAGDIEEERQATLRENAYMGLPCGSDKFIEGLERAKGRPLKKRCRGRPRALQRRCKRA